MKKYRLTKITVRTREIISLRNDAARSEETGNETREPICPVCHSPLSVNTSIAGQAGDSRIETHRTARLLPGSDSGEQEK